MTRRTANGILRGILTIGVAFSLTAVDAQTPFTFRRPKDGTTVREKQRIEIPRASIKPGGFVALYLNNKFQVAIPPEDEEEGSNKPFTYFWDTKGTNVPDGEHVLRAILFEPSAAGDGGSVTETGRTEIRVTVANKIKDGPSSLRLRYRYREGDILEYSRNGKAAVVGGLTPNGKIGDEELGSVRSVLRLSIEDSRFNNAYQDTTYLIRNKLTALSILEGGQEQTFDPVQLSQSMYQEVVTTGRVKYETGERAGADEFTSLGLPVNNTIELPVLPELEVTVNGPSWRTPDQRIDIPGLSPAQQPKVTLENKLVGLEYENGRRTARIRQTFKGPLKEKLIFFGPADVRNPVVEFERDIYLAYESGQLVKMKRSLTISGTSTSPIGAPPTQNFTGGGSVGGGRAGGFTGPGAGGDLDFGGDKGAGTSFGGARGSSGRGGGAPSFGSPSGSSGRGGGAPQAGGGPGSGGRGGGFTAPGSGGRGGGAPQLGGGPGSGGRGGGAPQIGGGGGIGLGGVSGGDQQPHPVTLRSVTDTELLPTSLIGLGTARPAVKVVPTRTQPTNKKR